MIRLSLKFDVNRLREELQSLGDRVEFESESQQIALTHRPHCKDPFYDGIGSLYDSASASYLAEESDFSEFNLTLQSTYMHEAYKMVKTHFAELGRVRLMRLRPKTCLSVHRDQGFRLHIPIVTNEQCFMVFKDSGLVHLPADGHAYLTDTTLSHSAMNGTWNIIRTHMVFAICNAQREYFEHVRQNLGAKEEL